MSGGKPSARTPRPDRCHGPSSPQASGTPGEDRGPRLVSLPPLADATGEVANALFRPEEATRGYLLLMEGIIRLFGIPLAIDGAPQCLPVHMESPGDKPRHVPQQVASTHRAIRPHGPARRLACGPKPAAREMSANPASSATKPRDSYISLPTAWRSGGEWTSCTRISAD